MASRASLRGTPCQFVRPERARLNGSPEFCGSPSRFVWHGFDPAYLGKTKAEIKKYIRVQLLVCVDCALELVHEWGWHMKDNKCRLERMDVTKFRAHCGACGTTLWVAWDADAPQGYPGTHFWFCARCGARTVYMVDQLQDVWEVMGDDLAKQGVQFPLQLLQMLYQDWPNSRQRYWKFYDYVKHQMEVFTTTGEFEVND